jgi:hypothetical protein
MSQNFTIRSRKVGKSLDLFYLLHLLELIEKVQIRRQSCLVRDTGPAKVFTTSRFVAFFVT